MHCANPKKAASVFSSVLRRIKPTPSETKKDFKAANHLIAKLQRVAPSAVEIRLAGSLAKGTDLKGKNEFDIFMLFPRHYSHHDMTMLGISYARRAFHGMKLESRYAEHPYLQVFSGNYHADIVPAYKIEDIGQKGSSVDRSSLHTEFVNSRLDSKGKDDVRLLKQFMKNFGIYGAELRVEGFSGYLCELLIVKYGSFVKLLEAAVDWKEKPAITFDGSQDAKFDSPLVVIDPVDSNRNVAAVVANTSLSRFIFEARRFLSSPSEKFFFSKKPVRNAKEIQSAIKSRGTLSACVVFTAPKVVPDVLWPQLKKTAHALSRQLEEQEFGIFGLYHWSDGKTCAILFEFDRAHLPAIRKAAGPAVKFGRDVDAFVARHAHALNLHIEHDRMVAVERRGMTDGVAALRHALGKTAGLGVPQHMEKQLPNAKVLVGKSMVQKEFLEFLSDYFFAKIA